MWKVSKDGLEGQNSTNKLSVQSPGECWQADEARLSLVGEAGSIKQKGGDKTEIQSFNKSFLKEHRSWYAIYDCSIYDNSRLTGREWEGEP